MTAMQGPAVELLYVKRGLRAGSFADSLAISAHRGLWLSSEKEQWATSIWKRFERQGKRKLKQRIEGPRTRSRAKIRERARRELSLV